MSEAHPAQGPTGPLNLRRNPRAPIVTDPAGDPRLDEGIALFNQGEHWHAHEAWEPLWMGLEGDDKLALQGVIMAAAMLVQYRNKVPRGVANHWENVKFRLAGRRATGLWGIDVDGLWRGLEPLAAAAARGDFAQDAQVQIRRTK